MPNRLKNETSPYLLQHAENPVDWHPWSSEALEKARQENKPIFLSIGYSACHWCHVMAHESFEDPETARIMNDHFVNIKVDREERPDLDQIYMEAVVAMTGQGGWPMSVFLTPDGKPFYGGTYFPPERRYGMPSFRELLTAVQRAWHDDPNELSQTGYSMLQRLQASTNWRSSKTFASSQEFLAKASDSLVEQYDWKYGGWGQAPKFPAPMAVEYLLLQHSRGHAGALGVAIHALNKMDRGGLFDVIGGGFHRYSTDEKWLVPHFEKMLYDNAQLALVYLHAYLITGNLSYKRTCEQTLDFLQREMTGEHGGFFSSLDADSEGGEGKFYVWSGEELNQILPPDLAQFAHQIFNIKPGGNFERMNVLQKQAPDEELAAALDMSFGDFLLRHDQTTGLLFQARSSRIRPGTDDKVITFWNALAIIAFAEAGRYLQREDYKASAQNCASFLLNNMVHENRLKRSWRNGQARHEAFLEDYAALTLGLIALYQTDHNLMWLNTAFETAEEMVRRFQDQEGNGFFNTQVGSEGLIVRPKELQDNATASGNSLASMALLQLAAYYERDDWRSLAVQLFGVLAEPILQHPTAFPYWLQAIDFSVGPVRQVALVWPEKDLKAKNFLNTLWEKFRPRTILAASPIPYSRTGPDLLAERVPRDETATAYVCLGFECKLPVTNIEEFEKQLLPEP